MKPLEFAVLLAGILVAPACNQGLLGYPGVFQGSAGSCIFPETNGYTSCEDFLGTDYETQVGQSLCANITDQPGGARGPGPLAEAGSWSQDPCGTAGALGTCIVVPDGTGDSRTVQYTYYASEDPDSGVTANALNAETDCGMVGGVFTAAQ